MLTVGGLDNSGSATSQASARPSGRAALLEHMFPETKFSGLKEAAEPCRAACSENAVVIVDSDGHEPAYSAQAMHSLSSVRRQHSHPQCWVQSEATGLESAMKSHSELDGHEPSGSPQQDSGGAGRRWWVSRRRGLGSASR